MLSVYDPATSIRYFVQHTLWIGTITNQGSKEQIQKWLDGATSMNIIGSFGMTELGHSSFLRCVFSLGFLLSGF
jgi:alkylation response protein AidB-like acyl-CoA dehydrogenase